MRIVTRVQSFAQAFLLYSDVQPEEERAFRRYANANTGRMTSGIAVLACVALIVWWPTDWIMFPGEYELQSTAAIWRLQTLACFLPILLLPRLFTALQARVVPLATVCMGLGCACLCWTSGGLGMREAAWFGACYVVPLASVMLFVPFVPRILITLTYAAICWCSYFLPHPWLFDEEPYIGLSLSQMLISAFMGIALGHLIYHYMRVGFFAQEGVARTNDRLASLVAEQKARLRHLADELETLREEEHRRIARELHDELGQVFTAIRYEVSLLETAAARDGVPLEFEELDFLLDRMLERFRSMLVALRPRVLDDFGFVAAAEWLVGDIRKRSGLEVTFTVDPPGLRLDRRQAGVAFRALQESLSNVVEHAGSARVAVAASLQQDRFILTVQDNGRGLASGAETRVGGVGILATRERARTIGGDFTVGPAPERGTLATLSLRPEGARS